jgi:hypothetical protein
MSTPAAVARNRDATKIASSFLTGTNPKVAEGGCEMLSRSCLFLA